MQPQTASQVVDALSPVAANSRYLANKTSSEGSAVTKSAQIKEMILILTKGKPLALPWGRTLRLDSGVRVRNHVIRGIRKIENIVPFGVSEDPFYR
nr:hypothetical protein [Tanacetum cinerariifolium]